jgi:hypothetical protein
MPLIDKGLGKKSHCSQFLWGEWLNGRELIVNGQLSLVWTGEWHRYCSLCEYTINKQSRGVILTSIYILGVTIEPFLVAKQMYM